MENHCLTPSIVYNAKVTTTENPIGKNYIGLTEGPFKQRYTQHALSFRNRHYANSTELSKFKRVNPVFKKDDETEIGNYRPLSLLSVTSKILESTVADAIINHTITENNLITENQWAYKKGYSTELLLINMTEIWRKAIDANKVVGVVLVDFQKAFDCVSRDVLLFKLENNFAIRGVLLTWLSSYLNNRNQFTILNGKKSDLSLVKYGIPQGSVLGPTLFSLYTSDLPDAVNSGTVYMYADDTTLYCIGDSIDVVSAEINIQSRSKVLGHLTYFKQISP